MPGSATECHGVPRSATECHGVRRAWPERGTPAAVLPGAPWTSGCAWHSLPGSAKVCVDCVALQGGSTTRSALCAVLPAGVPYSPPECGTPWHSLALPGTPARANIQHPALNNSTAQHLSTFNSHSTFNTPNIPTMLRLNISTSQHLNMMRCWDGVESSRFTVLKC